MRKPMTITVVALLLTTAITGAVLAGGGPRLAGKFAVTGSVQSSDFKPPIPPGSPVRDTFTFKPTCETGGCEKVKLTRSAGGRNVKSTLKRVKPGVYRGSEGPENYTCVDPIGTPGKFTATNRIKVTKSKQGKATKISGTAKLKFTGCTETFENTKFTGTPK